MKLAIGDELFSIQLSMRLNKRLKRLGKSSRQRLNVLLMLDHDWIKNADTTFGMGNKVVDDTQYKLTPRLLVLITNIHPRDGQWKANDYQVYKSLVAQTKVKSFPSSAGTARPHATWKWKHMIRKMVIPGERIAEAESEDTDDTDSVESYPDIASIGDINRTAPGILTF